MRCRGRPWNCVAVTRCCWSRWPRRSGEGEDVGAPTQIETAAIRAGIVLTRFAGVPKVALRCAQAASVLGTQFRPELAVRVAQLDDLEADTALRRAVPQRTSASADRAWQLSSCTRCSVRPSMTTWRYQYGLGLHARAFTELNARGLHDEALDHATRADLSGDDVALEAMTRAGMAALRSGAPTLATRHLQTAVRTAGSRAGADLLLALAESLLVAGRPREVIPVCDRLRLEPELTSAQQVKLLGILGCAFSATGHTTIRRHVSRKPWSWPKRTIQPWPPRCWWTLR